MLKVSLIGWGEELDYSCRPGTLLEIWKTPGRLLSSHFLLFPGLPLLVVVVTVSVDRDNYGLVSYYKPADGASDKL